MLAASLVSTSPAQPWSNSYGNADADGAEAGPDDDAGTLETGMGPREQPSAAACGPGKRPVWQEPNQARASQMLRRRARDCTPTR